MRRHLACLEIRMVMRVPPSSLALATILVAQNLLLAAVIILYPRAALPTRNRPSVDKGAVDAQLDISEAASRPIAVVIASDRPARTASLRLGSTAAGLVAFPPATGHGAAAKRLKAVARAAGGLLDVSAGVARADLVEKALVQWSADGDADADHGYGDFGGGPDDQADCVLCNKGNIMSVTDV